MLLSEAHEEFYLPGREFNLEKLAADFDKVVMKLQWHNTFKRKQETVYEIDLKRQKDSWYEAGLLLPPEDVPTQLRRC